MQEKELVLFRLMRTIVENTIRILGDNVAITFVIDGAPFPLKARTHAIRAKQSQLQYRVAHDSYLRPGQGVQSPQYQRAARRWVRYTYDVKHAIVNVSSVCAI